MSEAARSSENGEFNICCTGADRRNSHSWKEGWLAKSQKPLQSPNRASHKVKSHLYCKRTQEDQITFVKASAQRVLQGRNVT